MVQVKMGKLDKIFLKIFSINGTYIIHFSTYSSNINMISAGIESLINTAFFKSQSKSVNYICNKKCEKLLKHEKLAMFRGIIF
jgi:hypothetical protein